MANKKITDLQLKSSVVGDENLPVDNGIQSYRVTPSQMWDYMRTRLYPEAYEISNLTIVTSVGSNALTIAVKTKAGTNATATDLIRVGFRHATLTDGSFQLRSITGALSLVISSGSTLGQVSGQPSRIWVYLIDNAGTPELAASHSWYPENGLVSTTAEGGAGAADSATAIYSTSARSNVAIRCIGYIDNTQTTAGTWASAGTTVQLLPMRINKPPTIQVFTSGSGTYYTPAGCVAIRVRLVGGGGSGGTFSADGAAGNNTTFGGLTGSGGAGAGSSGAPAAGGSASGGDINIAGGGGTGGGNAGNDAGGCGGSTPFGGGGAGARDTGAGQSAPANSGGGGGGGSVSTTSRAGGGGGGYVEKLYVNPDASYAYAVGAGGTAPTNAGNGGSGIIVVEEYY